MKISEFVSILADDWQRLRWTKKGDTACRRGDFELAIRYFERSPRCFYALASAWVGRASQLLEAGQEAEAEAAFRKAADVRPHWAEPRARLGALALRQGRPAEAGQHFADALRRDSRRQDAWDALHLLGRADEAMTIRLDPDRYPLEGQVGSHFWFHSIELPNGLVTPGQCSPTFMQARYAETFDPLDLAGRSVIDFGAWNGAFSHEAIRRKASHVLAVDDYAIDHPDLRGRETFELVNRATGRDIELRQIDLDAPRLDLSNLGQFDVVLFLGVLYHLRDPLAALREVASVTREALVVETEIFWPPTRRPMMRYLPRDDLAGDPTNWWVPNVVAMKELLAHHGFRRVHFSLGIGPFRGVFHAYRT